jgi:hypothetical protein
MPVPGFALILGRRSFTGSLIGGVAGAAGTAAVNHTRNAVEA